MNVPAIKAVIHDGRSYVRGEMITCPAADALAMARRGEVTLTRGAHIEIEKPKTRRRRRTYRRRDMTAE